MRRLAVFLLCSAIAGGGIVIACGDDDSTPAAPTVADAAVETAAVTEASTPTGLDPHPGKLECGAVECTIERGNVDAASICCAQPDGSDSCETREMTNCSAKAWRITCDEPADCPSDTPVCCANVIDSDGVIFGASTCQAGCFNNQLPMCRTHEQCGDAGPCRSVTCGNNSFHMCGMPALCH